MIGVGGTRHYGLTVGARVSYPIPGTARRRVGTVVELAALDNNRAYVLFDGEREPWPSVCEWCEVLPARPAE